jgi:iron complex transport system permease protein
MGSFGQALWPQIALMTIVVIIVIPFVYAMSTALNIYLLGDDQAKSLGLAIPHFRKKTIVLTGLLVAVVTAFCGPIGFIGLIAPHLVRMALKTASHSALLTPTLLTGSVLALASDCAVRWLNVPLNAITALIGAPVVLLVILRRTQK